VSDPAADSAVDSLYFRWQAFRTAGRDVPAAVLCRERPELAAALAQRIAAEQDSEADADRTGGYTPQDSGGADSTAESASGRYHIMREHARGGMGRVCEAVDTELNRRVAYKDIQAKFAQEKESRHRFVREALITGQLEHPGVIPVYGLGTDEEGRPYYAMRFVEGESLKEALKRFHADAPKRMPTGSKAVEFRGLLKRFVDVCNAVAFAHSRNFVHRDLKPANVMLGPFGETLVVDWGLARSFKDKSPDAVAGPVAPVVGGAEDTDQGEATLATDTGVGTRTGQIMGTPAYMSPEQSVGNFRTLGPAWDIYSLGATLYEILVGKVPFTGKAIPELIQDIQAGIFPAPRSIAPWVPKALDAAVRKAMALRPGDRYTSALELSAELDRYLADEPVQAYRESLPERLRRWARRNRGWVTAGAVAMFVSLFVLGAGLFFVNSAREAAVEEERLKSRALDSERSALAQTKAALQAEEEANARARAALDTVTDEVVGRLLGKQADIGPEEKKFLAKLIANYEKHSATSSTKPESVGLAAEAKLRVARIYEKLGDLTEAAKYFREAADGFRPLVTQPSPALEHRRSLSAAALGYAKAALRRDGAAALASMTEGLLLREAMYKEDTTDPVRAADFISALLDGADILLAGGKPQQAKPLYETIVNNFTQPLLRGQLGRNSAEVIAQAFDQLAFVLTQHQQPPDLAGAYKQQDNALGVFKILERTFPAEPAYRSQKNLTLVSRSMVKFKDNKAGEAATDLSEAIGELTTLVEQYPAMREFRAGLGRAHINAAIVALSRKQREVAIKHLTDSRAEFVRLRRVYPNEREYGRALLEVTKELALQYQVSGDSEQAKAMLAEVAILNKTLLKDN